MSGLYAKRRHSSPPWLNLLVFTLVGVALLGSVLTIFNTISAERAERNQARRTNEILVELRNIGRAAANAETGQRGFYITLDQRYLDPYRVAQEMYKPSLARLRELVGDNPTDRQAELLDEIGSLTEKKFTGLEQSVAQIERGELLSVQRQILSDEGQETMTRLRRALAEMEEIESDIIGVASERAATAEARVMPLLGALLVMLLGALALGYWQVSRAARAAAIEAQAQDLADARDRADLLARELNHRVKNLFAVILAIVRMSARGHPEAKPVVDNIAQRIHALLTAHEVTQGKLGNQKADLGKLVETTLAPHRTSSSKGVLEGPEIALPARQVTPLGLVLHELSTNAVKYGAWSQGGTLDVTWQRQDGELVLLWKEHCPQGCTKPQSKGFGSQLIDSSARQLQGRIDRDFQDDGVEVRIAIPLTDGTEVHG